MIKILLSGLWAAILAVGAVFGVLEWQKNASAGAMPNASLELQEFRTKAINVPIIGEGVIQGYMVAQFVFTVDALALAKMPVSPEVYVLDEAFKTIYAGEQVNFQRMKKQDLPLLAKTLGENVNKRLGTNIIQDVLIDQLSYIPKTDVRGPPKS